MIKGTKNRHDRERNDFQGKEQVLLLVYKYDSCFHVQSLVLFTDFTRRGLLLKRRLIKNLKNSFMEKVSRNSAVGITTGYGLDDREVGVRVPVGSRIITSPCRPDRLWGPSNLLYNGYRELFPGGKADGA
jgi:hypothetical protein